MFAEVRAAATTSLLLIATLVVLGARPAPLSAQEEPALVQISIVNGEIKIVNRGVGLCRSQIDCRNRVIWRWVGADPNPNETEKIVISFVAGTDNASSCFKDSAGNPRVFYEILERNGEASATVHGDCPAKSAWLYQISCIRTDEGYAGELCTGIAPVDPGVVIG